MKNWEDGSYVIGRVLNIIKSSFSDETKKAYKGDDLFKDSLVLDVIISKDCKYVTIINDDRVRVLNKKELMIEML